MTNPTLDFGSGGVAAVFPADTSRTRGGTARGRSLDTEGLRVVVRARPRGLGPCYKLPCMLRVGDDINEIALAGLPLILSPAVAGGS